MKQREQALLLLRKAAQDEALLDAVLTSDQVSDDFDVHFRTTHKLGALGDLLAHAGHTNCRTSLLTWIP